MENRCKLSQKIQIELFNKIEKKSGFKTIELASLFGISARSYSDWRNGKHSIPEKVISIIDKEFNIRPYGEISRYIDKWKFSQKTANQIGGKERIRLYGYPSTPEGRIKGGKRALFVARARGLIPSAKPFYPPQSYSEDLAEFYGILLGDGHIDKYQWSISLNAKKDKNYSEYVISLIKKLFKFNPSCRIRSEYNVIIIIGNGIKSVQYLIESGLKVGNKIKNQVDVPEWIKSNISYRNSCLRGLVDTDGGIFKNTYTVNHKDYTYNKLVFVNRSIPLLIFAHESLKNLGFNPTLIEKVPNKRVWLSNQMEIKKYLQVIGTNNNRLADNLI
jgi:intein/homing endonuclease